MIYIDGKYFTSNLHVELTNASALLLHVLYTTTTWYLVIILLNTPHGIPTKRPWQGGLSCPQRDYKLV